MYCLNPNNEEIVNAIFEDEYYSNLSKHVLTTFSIVCSLDDGEGNSTIENIYMVASQSKISLPYCLSDLIKLTFLGYITFNRAASGDIYYSIGSIKFYDLIKSKRWKLISEKIKIGKINHLKLWLHSKINSVKGENYLTRYQGKTIEQIFQIDPDYIVEKIRNGNFILSLTSLEILGDRYNYNFPNRLIEYLKSANEEYNLKKQFVDPKINIKTQIELEKELKDQIDKESIERDNFIDYLKLNNYPYRIIDDKIEILSDFNWNDSVKLINNLMIIGNLKVFNFVGNSNIIPAGLSVSGYIQFGPYFYRSDEIENCEFDVWMKL